MRNRSYLCVFAALLLAVPAFGLTTKSIDGGATAAEIAATLTGPGAIITNVKVTGSTKALGLFEQGTLGVTSGVIMSTGDIATAIGPNNTEGAGLGLGAAGDSQLDLIVTPNKTFDATVLEFDIITKTPFLSISYVFGSEEYTEYVDDVYNDVFAFYVDGRNIAITPGSSQPVTINTINHLRNTSLYRDNQGGTGTQLDGYTVPLIASALITPNETHHIKLVIADTADAILDSAVFLEEGGISGAAAPALVPTVSEIFLNYTDTVEIPVAVYYVFDNIPYTFTASGLPDATVTFSPLFIGEDGRQYTTVKVKAGQNTPQGTHLLLLHSTTADAQFDATITAHVDCRAPAILGTGQPATQVVNRGSTASFTVAPIGSGPFTYQWFTGFTGMTRTPVAGATSATFTTPAVNEASSYWVRVSNPCGTYDSVTAFVIPR